MKILQTQRLPELEKVSKETTQMNGAITSNILKR